MLYDKTDADNRLIGIRYQMDDSTMKLYTVIPPYRLPSGKFYRLTNETETHRGLTYKTGLNIDPKPFNPTGTCSGGGMYFFHEEQLPGFLSYCMEVQWWIREVTFPEDAQIYVEESKYKCDKFILGERKVVPSWMCEMGISNHTAYGKLIPVRERPISVHVALSNYDRNYLDTVPEDVKTADFYTRLVEYDYSLFRKVPQALLTTELCMKCVSYCSSILEDVPDELMTTEMCQLAVNTNYTLFQYVPRRLLTQQMCSTAFDYSHNAIQCIPHDFITAEMVERSLSKGTSLSYIPKVLLTQEMYAKYLRNDYHAIHCIPREFITAEACLAAVECNSTLLRFVPDELITVEMCVSIIPTRGNLRYKYTFVDSVQYIPSRFKLQVQDYIIGAFKIGAIAFKDIPQALLTEKVCLNAIELEPHNYFIVPLNLLTEEMCVVACEECNDFGHVLSATPKELLAEEVCARIVKVRPEWYSWFGEDKRSLRSVALEAVKNASYLMDSVPATIRTHDFILDAVGLNGNVLSHISDAEKTPEVCLKAIEHGGDLSQVPLECLTPELCLKAVKMSGSSIKHVPRSLLTPEMCLSVVRNNGWAITHIPSDLVTTEMRITTVLRCNSLVRQVPNEKVSLILLSLTNKEIAPKERLAMAIGRRLKPKDKLTALIKELSDIIDA